MSRNLWTTLSELNNEFCNASWLVAKLMNMRTYKNRKLTVHPSPLLEHWAWSYAIDICQIAKQEIVKCFRQHRFKIAMSHQRLLCMISERPIYGGIEVSKQSILFDLLKNTWRTKYSSSCRQKWFWRICLRLNIVKAICPLHWFSELFEDLTSELRDHQQS